MALTCAAETNLEHNVARHSKAHHERPPAQQYGQDGLHIKASQDCGAGYRSGGIASDHAKRLPALGKTYSGSALTVLSLLWLLW